MVIPIAIWYALAEIGLYYNRLREHPNDAALGYTFLLFGLDIILIIGLLYDIVKKIIKKETKLAILDLILIVGIILFTALFFNFI